MQAQVKTQRVVSLNTNPYVHKQEEKSRIHVHRYSLTWMHDRSLTTATPASLSPEQTLSAAAAIVFLVLLWVSLCVSPSPWKPHRFFFFVSLSRWPSHPIAITLTFTIPLGHSELCVIVKCKRVCVIYQLLPSTLVALAFSLCRSAFLSTVRLQLGQNR